MECDATERGEPIPGTLNLPAVSREGVLGLVG